MKNKNLTFLKIVIVAVLGFVSCKKSDITPSQKTELVKLDKSVIKAAIVPYVFDWETADYMPTPLGTTPILVPWASGSNKQFPTEFNTDYKKIDGWELVYNTFSTSTFAQPAHFILYNKYRGILRGFFYLQPTTPVSSNYITHTLKLNGHPLKMLNFSTRSRIDLSNAQMEATIVQPYRTTATGTWYAAEFEMAYDPSTEYLNASSNDIQWSVYSTAITNFTLNGSSQGQINGTIGQPKSTPGLFGSLIKGALHVGGLGVLNNISDQALNATYKDKIKQKLQSGIEKNATNLLSAIFGGKGGMSYQQVSLKTYADYQFEGSAASTSLITSPSLIIPGTIGQNNVVGYTPLYNKAMGIFTLASNPTLNVRYVNSTVDRIYFDRMKLNEVPIEVIYNPSIINDDPDGASVSNFKMELLDTYDPNNTNTSIYHPGVPRGGQVELIANNTYARVWEGADAVRQLRPEIPQSTDYMYMYGDLSKHKFIRVSFDVVPNNGAPITKIVKTFCLKIEVMDFGVWYNYVNSFRYSFKPLEP